MFFGNQSFFVFGLSLSGRAAAMRLRSLGAEVFVYDDGAPRIEKTVSDLVKIGCKSSLGNPREGIDLCDVVVLSPGIPVDNELAVYAKKSGKRVIGELELGYLLSKATFVCVTGTNGKTTVCSLIKQGLDVAGKKSELAGNIGVPLTEVCDRLCNYEIAVTEVSSFQLETIHSLTPHIAAVLNVTPDHLDRHYSFENYVYLKKRLLANMRESEYAVLNYDDETVRSFADKARFKTVWFSIENRVDGAYEENGKFYYKGEEILDRSSLALEGVHNEKNALAALCVLKLCGVENDSIRKAFSAFKGVRHRTELIYEKNGVKYFNDSKSTNVDSAIKAIEAMKRPTVVILGGRDKGQDFLPLFAKIKRSCVVHAVLTGESRFKLLEAAEKEDFYKVSVTPSFESAIRIAKIESKDKNDVLLSPACSSFDCFYDYAERGREFERIVKEINEG